MENDLESLNKQIKELEPKASKGRAISSVVITAHVFVIGLILMIYGCVFVNIYLVLGLVFIVTGLLMSIFSAVILPDSIRTLKEKNRICSKYDSLVKERNLLLMQSKASNNDKPSEGPEDESKEDALLRLLSEGKITVEDYKKLKK